MAYRILISLIVLACAYLAFETVRFKLLQRVLLNTEAEYVLGNPDGDITFVKLFDYSCKACRDAYPIIARAIEQDGNVKFLVRPAQVMDTEGINSALLPYAAAKQGKFGEMHRALIENYRVIDDQVLQDLSLEIGIDHEKLKADLENKDVLVAMNRNFNLIQDYRMHGIPAYAVGDKILFTPHRDLSVNDFLTLFNEARGQ